MKDNERYIWLDALRIIAGISMVGLHSTSDTMGQPFVDYDVSDRIAPMLLRAVIYVARTELFIIIALFLLLMALDRRPRTYPQVIGEQAKRLLVPFAFWTFFYAFYNLVKASAFGYEAAVWENLANPIEWLGYLFLGDVKYHMHFIPTLFGVVLAYPFYRLAVSQPILGLAVIGALAMRRELDLFLYSTFWGHDALPWLVRGLKIASYVGYGMVAGALLGLWRKGTPEARQAFFLPVLFAGLFLFLAKLQGLWLTVIEGKWQHTLPAGYWADYLMPVVLFAGCMCLGHKRWPQAITRIAPYSFGIYLCHPIFLDLIEIALSEAAMSPIAQVATKIAGTLIGTAILVVVIRRIKPLGWTIGLGKLPGLPMLGYKPKAELS